MDIKFEKSALQYLETVADEVKTCEETQQVRLADTLPDIKQVVTGWGQVVIRGKQWVSDQIQTSGGVKVWILYKSEDNSCHCVETWVPFQLAWDIPPQTRDGCVTIRPYLRNVDVRALSDRKIIVRVTVGVLAQAVVINEKEICYPDKIPEVMEILENTYHLNLPVECGEKMINIEEACELPTGSKVIRCIALPSLLEYKIVADKIVMRGMVKIDVLSLCGDGRILRSQFEYPFSQFAQLEKEYDKYATADIVPIITELEIEQNDTDEEMIRCSLLGQYTIYEIKNVSVVEDAYSAKRNVDINTQGLKLPSLLNWNTQALHAASDIVAEVGQVLDVFCYIDELNIKNENDGLLYSTAGMFQILYADEAGDVACAQRRWDVDFRSELSVAADVCATVKMDEFPQNMGTHLSQNLTLEVKSISNAQMPIVSGIEIGEADEQNPNRPSVIICAIGEERLWDLAKRTGSSVTAIKQANNLGGEPEFGRMLLIPVN